MSDSNVNRLNQIAYDAIAQQYAGDEPGEDDPVMRAECRQIFIDALKGKDVLEIGCGPGVDASFLQQAGMKVTATDFSDEFVRIVRERFPKVIAHRMDMSAPNLPKNSFDGIYSFASFIHLPRSQAQQTLNGLSSLLRSSGVLFMALIKSSKVPEYVIQDLGGRPNNPLLFTCYQFDEIEKLLKNAGFRTVKFHEVESPLYKNMPRLVERGVSQYQLLAAK